MANFCLNPQLADQFKKDILDGKINPEELASMTSQERHAFFADIKRQANKFSKADLKAPGRLDLKIGNSIAGNAKALKASMDNSAIFRQGWKTLLTHPGIWQKNARQSFVDLVQSFGGKAVMD